MSSPEKEDFKKAYRVFRAEASKDEKSVRYRYSPQREEDSLAINRLPRFARRFLDKWLSENLYGNGVKKSEVDQKNEIVRNYIQRMEAKACTFLQD